MRVSNDLSTLKLLGSTVVVGVCVDKVSCDHVLDVHLEGEIRIGGEGASIGREGNLRARHAAGRDDISIDDTIAASLNELLTIGECLSLAVVDAINRLDASP